MRFEFAHCYLVNFTDAKYNVAFGLLVEKPLFLFLKKRKRKQIFMLGDSNWGLSFEKRSLEKNGRMEVSRKSSLLNVPEKCEKFG